MQARKPCCPESVGPFPKTIMAVQRSVRANPPYRVKNRAHVKNVTVAMADNARAAVFPNVTSGHAAGRREGMPRLSTRKARRAPAGSDTGIEAVGFLVDQPVRCAAVAVRPGEGAHPWRVMRGKQRHDQIEMDGHDPGRGERAGARRRHGYGAATQFRFARRPRGRRAAILCPAKRIADHRAVKETARHADAAPARRL